METEKGGRMEDEARRDRHVARGAAVNYAAFFAGKVIAFLNTVVLARLLLPEHFGIVALGLLVIAVAEMLGEAGIGAAIVWRNGDIEDSAPEALAIGLIMGGVIAGVLVLMAREIATFFGTPEATGIIQVLALCVVLGIPASVFAGILQKRMQFGRRALPEVARALAKGAVGIPLALAGAGAWSLVYSHLAGVVVGLVLLWRMSQWRPRLSLRRDVLREVLPYGVQIAAVGLVGLAIRKLDVVVIGRSFEAEQLGLYTLAFSLVELSVMGVVWAASGALFPALAQKAGDMSATRASYQRGLTLLLAIVLPMGLGLILLAEPFILTVFGAKWAGAVGLVQVLALYAMMFSLGFNLGDIHKAAGRPQVLTLINLANLALAVPVLLLLARFGPVGVAAGQVIVAAAISLVNWVVAWRLAQIPIITLWHAVRAPLPALGAMAAVCLGLDHWLTEGWPEAARLVMLTLASVGGYACVLAFTFAPLRARLFGP